MPGLIGLGIQHHRCKARYAGKLAIGALDFRLPDLGAATEMERSAESGDGLAFWDGGEVIGIHLQPHGMLTLWQG